MFHNGIYAISKLSFHQAFIAQLGERQTEDLEVSSSILLEGILFYFLPRKSRMNGYVLFRSLGRFIQYHSVSRIHSFQSLITEKI